MGIPAAWLLFRRRAGSFIWRRRAAENPAPSGRRAVSLSIHFAQSTLTQTGWVRFFGRCSRWASILGGGAKIQPRGLARRRLTALPAVVVSSGSWSTFLASGSIERIVSFVGVDCSAHR